MSGLKFGSHMSIAGGVSQALDRAGSIGSNAVQIFTKNNRQWSGPPVDESDVERWHTQIAPLGIEYVVSHASYLINLASVKDDLWLKSRAAHADELLRAHTYGVRHVVLHPGAHTGSGVDAGIHRIAEALNRIHDATPAASDTMTLLELMAGQGTVIGRNFSELRRIIELVEDKTRVGVCVDTCHAFAAGYELRTSDGYAALMIEIEQEIGLAKVGCWHFNDSKGKLGSHVDRHEHIGEGEIGLEGFRHIINDPRWYNVAMLLETPKDEDLVDDVKNLAALCGLASDHERVPLGLRPKPQL